VGYGLQRLRRAPAQAPVRDPVTAWARTLTALEGDLLHAHGDLCEFALLPADIPRQRLEGMPAESVAEIQRRAEHMRRRRPVCFGADHDATSEVVEARTL
jgi:hypothetical protein